MIGNFSSSIWAGRGFVPRAAGAAATVPNNSVDCDRLGGSWEQDPTGRGEFTCILPRTVNSNRFPVPGSTGVIRAPSGTGDQRTVPMNGVTDQRTVPMNGVTDQRTVPPSRVTDQRTAPPSGVSDQRGPAPGTTDRRVPSMPVVDMHHPVPSMPVMGFGGTGDVAVPTSGVSDWCPPGYRPTVTIPACPNPGLVPATAADHARWSATRFASNFVNAPVGGVGTSYGFAPWNCTAPAPMAHPILGIAGVAARPAGAVIDTSDPTTLLLSAGALALGAYVGWKLGASVSRRST